MLALLSFQLVCISHKGLGALLGSPLVSLVTCFGGVNVPCWGWEEQGGLGINHQFEGAHSSYLALCSVLHGCGTARP